MDEQNKKSEKSFYFLAVILGVIVDNVGTFLSSACISLIFLSTQSDNEQDLMKIYSYTGWLAAFLVIGMFWSFYGAYVAAKVAKRAEYFNAGCIGVIGAAVGFDSLISNPGVAFWYQIIGLIVIVPVSLLGGHVALRRKHARSMNR